MNTRTIGVVAAITGAVTLLCVAGPAVLIGGAASVGCQPATTSASADTLPAVASWDSEQVTNAQVIVSVGVHKAVQPRGWIIAVATAMQESGLRNVAGGDRDSIGLFQQRPSQGWGTPDQLADPVYAAGRFYDKLLTVDGWPSLPLTEAAQRVQVSAYPDAYAKWEDDATELVSLLTDGLLACNSVGPGGWVVPVDGPIVSGFRTPERPRHDGVDIAVPRGTVIRVAATGTVLTARCNVAPETHGCDRDGSPAIRGCGWYVDLRHAAGVITRYCHMQTQPFVHEGQTVVVGQPLGLVGSSGHSSGPHLHYEAHLDGDRSSDGAVDPVGFMCDVGAPLGE